MTKSKHSEAAMIAALRQVDAGRTAAEVGREVGVSAATIYAWKAKYGGMSVSEAQEAKQLRNENARLKQLVAGLSLDKDASYTWSKALGVNVPLGEGGLGARDPFNRQLDYGPLSFNRTNSWVTTFIWDLPFGQHLSLPILRGLASGWELNAINTVRSGSPLTVRSGRDPLLNGDNLGTADLVGNPSLAGGRSEGERILEWFNINAFSQPAIGTYGTTGVNTLTGPGTWNVDCGIYKSFKIKEDVNLQLRGEFYNMLNHTNLGDPNTTLSNGTFGRITSTGDPRVIEVGAHLSF